MKLLHLHLLLRSLAVLLCLLVLGGEAARAQSPIAENVDVFFGENKLLTVDRPIDDFTVTPDNIVKITKVDGAPNQLSILGLASGSAMLTLKSDGRTLLYSLSVSPAPERLYINMNESKRLSFPNTIDDTSLSMSGIVKVVTPDTSDRVLLLEARSPGKTTLTVTCKGELYRYFISTFDNRGADILEIQNAFSAKGYRNLSITFNKDQAIISGTVPTQEELDDAVRIVKQFTQFVVIKAQLGQDVVQSEFTEEETIIINNIQRIANVKGLTVRVKFPAPTVVTTSTYTKSIGDYVAPVVTTTPQGGTVRGAGFEPPKDPNNQTGTSNSLEPKPQQNTTETTTISKNTTIPEKIFLYGDLQDDLEEARVIRVARTFCPFIVSFITVRDPIQLRTQLRFMQVNDIDTRNAGFYWTGGGQNGGPSITLGFGESINHLFYQGGSVGSILTGVTQGISYGVTGVGNATATFELLEQLGFTKSLRQADLFLTNGQPGWYSEGEIESYISSSVTTASSPPLTTLVASSVFLGINMDIAPLNVANAGGVEPTGQKIYGIPGSLGSTGGGSYTLDQNSDATADKVSKVTAAIQKSGSAPIIDNTVKYVDENGLIGMDISTQLTIPDGSLTANKVSAGAGNGSINLPNFFVRTTRTRVNLRDGQSVTINGLIDKEVSKTIRQVPFLANIPLFGNLFKSHTDFKQNQEVVVLVTPHIVRMRDEDSARYPKPVYPEMQDLARERGDIPIIKPVRYDASAVDIRAESPKDLKDDKSDAISAPTAATPSTDAPALVPHASGGMQALQPPAETSAPAKPAQPVDNAASAPDSTRQPSTSTPALAPNSTLP